LFTVVSVTVRMFVCQHDNSRTVRDIVARFSWYHSSVQREAKFGNVSVAVHGW